ncbi:MAG: pyruvate formate lyase 1-activating protein, partial [Bacteroidales bacterium]|nr:pyruvate formate lyase 1-activating protein [Bacteroidales bacterium]
LPYHDMGTKKYEQMGMDYRLKGVAPLTDERLQNARTIFKKAGLRL